MNLKSAAVAVCECDSGRQNLHVETCFPLFCFVFLISEQNKAFTFMFLCCTKVSHLAERRLLLSRGSIAAFPPVVGARRAVIDCSDMLRWSAAPL